MTHAAVTGCERCDSRNYVDVQSAEARLLIIWARSNAAGALQHPKHQAPTSHPAHGLSFATRPCIVAQTPPSCFQLTFPASFRGSRRRRLLGLHTHTQPHRLTLLLPPQRGQFATKGEVYRGAALPTACMMHKVPTFSEWPRLEQMTHLCTATDLQS